MSTSLSRKHNHKLFELFYQSTLGLYCDSNVDALFAKGTTLVLNEGAPLPSSGERRLIVVLSGCAVMGRDWFGPGNHVEQTDQPVLPLKGPATLWVLEMTGPEWTAAENLPLRRATTHALIAADAAEAAATPPAVLPDPATLCDVDHPEIRRRAARLRRTTQAATAEAILQFVNQMPYRFGTWQERASETLARGIGMCTTKSNLQVALMRASGLEAGFVEMPMSTTVLGKLMPAAWLDLQRDTVRHYFAAVKLDGRWHGADSSYDPVSARIYVETLPHLAHLLDVRLSIGRPYAPALEMIEGVDMFDIDVRPEINDAMGKSSRFLPRHFEALNTAMDRARGYHKTWNRALETGSATTDEVTA